MNSDSEEKAVRAVIQCSGCTHQHKHRVRRMEPCWRGFLLHNVLLGALQGITHNVDGVHVYLEDTFASLSTGLSELETRKAAE